MANTLKQFKTRVLARPDVKKASDDLAEEFAFLDEVLKARSGSGLTQAEVAARIGTTQSAIARLESAEETFPLDRHASKVCEGPWLQGRGSPREEFPAAYDWLDCTDRKGGSAPFSLVDGRE